jgi:hypothetical protein
MLSERFYDEVRTSPVPIDMRAMKALKKSPLALDVYFWIVFVNGTVVWRDHQATGDRPGRVLPK